MQRSLVLMSGILLCATWLSSGCESRKPASTPALEKPPVEKASAGKVELKSATLKEVEADIAKQKGKIVVMDLWGEWCGPCKREFPGLVKIHHEHGKDGVACYSLCLTAAAHDEDTKEERARAEAFLKKQGAEFTNFWLEGKKPFDVAQERWKFEGIPVVLVYGRDGELAKKFTQDDEKNQFTYEDVETLVTKLLAEKQAK